MLAAVPTVLLGNRDSSSPWFARLESLPCAREIVGIDGIEMGIQFGDKVRLFQLDPVH